MDYDQLEALSTAALSSPYQSDRDSASDALRGLTSYESFPFLRKALVEIPDQSLYSCVLLCKALKFVVLNELGPSERQDMQNLALDLVTRKATSASYQSPAFVLKSILSIYAAGLFLNFRLMLFGSKDGLSENQSQRSALGDKAMSQLAERIGMENVSLVLMAMTEVILHFSSEEKKNQTANLRRAFASEIIPSFFAYAVSQLHTTHTHAALELCVLCLELVPSGGSAPLVNISLHTDESLYLHPATAWLPPLRDLAGFCANAINEPASSQGPSTSSTNDEPGGLVAISQQILRSMSCAVFTDWRDGSSLLTLTDGFFKNLMPIATGQIRRFIERMSLNLPLDRDDVMMLEHAIAMAVNVFERNDLFVGSYVYNNVDLFTSLATVASEFKNRMLSSGQLGENNILGKILHLFYVVGERGVPPLPCPSADQPPDAIRSTLVGSILSVTTTYLETIIGTAHMAEDNYDLSREGFMLNLDNVLTPMAEMLFSEVVDVVSLVDRYLGRTLSMHGLSTRLRAEGSSAISDSVDQEVASEMEFLCQSLFNSSISNQVGLLLVTRVLLSRLSVLISLIGLAVRLRSGRSNRLGSEERLADQALAGEVMNFIAGFISPDHGITDMMLQCMSLFEEGTGPDGGMGGPNGSNSSSAGLVAQTQLHIPLLRSLVYFCGCLHDTWISRQPQFLAITSEMLSFALIDHGDCFPLANDANILVRRLLEEHTALTSLDAIRHILEEHWSCNIMLTRNDFTPTDPDVRKLRSRTLTNIVKLSEARADVQLQQFVPQMVNLLVVEKDFELFLEDVTSVCEGVTYAVSLYSIVNMLVDNKQTIVEALTALPDDNGERTRVFGKLVKCWSVVCQYCCRLLESDNVSECLWSFASFCFDSLFYAIGDIKSRYSRSVESGNCLVPEQMMFDCSSIVISTLKGKWCNVGVMFYYGDASAMKTFTAVLELIVATPVQVIMSDYQRSPLVFAALFNALTTPCGFSQGLRNTHVWTDLVPFLMKCIGYRFFDLIASCLLILLRDSNVLIPSSIISNLCSIVLVTLTTSPLNEHEVLDLCEILISCHQREPERSEHEFNVMLDTASAYHRVRVRSFLTLLRSGAENAAQQYIEIFGTESTVATISGW